MSFDRSRATARRRFALGFALAVTAVLPLGCGHAGPPHPPLRAVPAAATDLAVRQRGGIAMLSVAYPLTTAAGKALDGLSALEVWEMARPVTTANGEAPEPVDLRLFASQAKQRQRLASTKEIATATLGPRIELELDLSKLPAPPPAKPLAGAKSAKKAADSKTTTPLLPAVTEPSWVARFFAVKMIGLQKDASGFSNQAVLVPKPPPTAPTKISVTPQANGVLISWEAAPPKPAPAKPAPPPLAPPAATAPVPSANPTPAPVAPATPAPATPTPTPVTATPTAPTSGAAASSTTPPTTTVAPASGTPAATSAAPTPAAAATPVPEPPLPPAAGGFYIYRRTAQEKRYAFQPLAVVRKRLREYVDSTAVFGQSYIYSVTQVDERDPQVESVIANEQELKYVDIYPPPVPTELVAVAESGTRVRLVWRASEARDLAGYFVYRLSGAETWKRVNDKPVTNPSYIDTTVTAGQAYQYRVTAIDQTGNESQPSDIARLSTPTG